MVHRFRGRMSFKVDRCPGIGFKLDRKLNSGYYSRGGTSKGIRVKKVETHVGMTKSGPTLSRRCHCDWKG